MSTTEQYLAAELAAGDVAGSADDRAWFARHHGRNHRLRKPIGAAELFCRR